MTVTLHWQPITAKVMFLISLAILRKSVLALFQHLLLLAHIASFLNERSHVSAQAHTMVQPTRTWLQHLIVDLEHPIEQKCSGFLCEAALLNLRKPSLNWRRQFGI